MQQSTSINKGNELRGKMGASFLNIFNVEGEASRKKTKSDSQKVLETFEIKTTKSIILNEIIDKSNSVSSFEDLREGNLIRIENVNLSLENEAELRTVKLFTNGAFKGMNIPGSDGFDINNVFNSMFKDYSYKMKGVVANSEDELLVKIPLTFESEFESSYSVDDLFIGKVTIVGLYKGKVKLESLKNSFEFFQEIGSMQSAITPRTNQFSEIQDSQYPIGEKEVHSYTSSSHGNKEYHYIDLLAIIQNIDIQN